MCIYIGCYYHFSNQRFKSSSTCLVYLNYVVMLFVSSNRETKINNLLIGTCAGGGFKGGGLKTCVIASCVCVTSVTTVLFAMLV